MKYREPQVVAIFFMTSYKRDTCRGSAAEMFNLPGEAGPLVYITLEGCNGVPKPRGQEPGIREPMLSCTALCNSIYILKIQVKKKL